MSVLAGNMESSNGLRYGWGTALTLLALATLLTMALLWPSVLSISHIWFNSETYAHGVIILPLALFLAWTRRKDLAREVPDPSAWGLAWLAAAGLAWMLARGVDVKLIQHFALVAMLPGLVISLLGLRVARLLIFPLAYLFFAVPFGDFIVPILQEYTAWFTVWMLQISGLPMYREGLYISIPAGDFVVAEECSGVRYLIASVALGLIYAYISYRSVWRRAALVALAIALPILANGLRAYGIIMIAHWTDMRHAVGVDHLIYGWVFFGFVMVLLFWLGSLWWEKNGEREREDSTSTGPGVTLLSPGIAAGFVAALVLVLAAPRGGEWLIEQRALGVVTERPAALPSHLSGWQGPEPTTGAWRPRFFDADTELAGVYMGNGGPVELHLFRYLNQGRGSEIVSYRNRIYDNETWRRSSERARRVDLPDGLMRVHETVMRGPGDARRVVWHWYQLGEHVTTRGVEVKLREAQRVFLGDGRGAFLVAVSAGADDSLDSARERLSAFLVALPMPLGYVHD